MLAQIKSNDDDVWGSLRRSSHLDGEPSDALTGRMRRMRNWVDGAHFPDAAKIVVQSSVGEEARANLTEAHEEFLSALSGALADCKWTDGAIGDCIRATIAEVGIGGRDAYVALYWVILGKHHGPKASSLMSEMSKSGVLSLIGSA